MIEFTPYRNKVKRVSDDAILDAADYSLAIAGTLGVDTTPADVALFGVEAARLALAPQEVEKPNNETAKLVASGASIALGVITRNKRLSSALGLLAMGIIDSTIQD